SGVTDALLASVALASEGRVEEATASLNETFHRHHHAAQELLTHTARGFTDYLDTAAIDISQLLKKPRGDARERAAVQDATVSFGELLSSRLLAELLNERGVTAQQVHP